MASNKITVADLEWASDWCANGYEPVDDETEAPARQKRVAAFLDREAERLRVAELALETGVSKRAVRKAIKRVSGKGNG